MIRYGESDVFTIPLRSGGFALGVIARRPKKGKILLGYFFGKKYESAPNDLNLDPKAAIKIVRFGDLGLHTGEWKVIGSISNWAPEEWPVPQFFREDPAGNRWLITYSDSDLSAPSKEEQYPPSIGTHERDSLMGAGAVELTLTKNLNTG